MFPDSFKMRSPVSSDFISGGKTMETLLLHKVSEKYL
jgi:hypothetical protein